MDLRDLLRRPLILVLLVITPFIFISRAIANTEPLPRTVHLADGSSVTTTMRDVHGADMTIIAVAFLAGLVGVFIMNAARQADGRLVRAGFGAAETVVARLGILMLCTVIVTAVSLATTARGFTPRQWEWFITANLVIGLTFAGLGALASALFGRIGATYLLLFLAMLDLGIIQNPMFGNSTPPAWAVVLPGYPGTRAVMNAALSSGHDMPLGIVLGMVAWLVGIVVITSWRLTVGLRTERSSSHFMTSASNGRRR
jgi:hypothetical protein